MTITADEILANIVHAVEEQRAIIEEHQDAIKEIYDRARAAGFDAKIVKIVVTKRALIREYGARAIEEIDALAKLYLDTVARVEEMAKIKPNGTDHATRAPAREIEAAPSALAQREPPIAQAAPMGSEGASALAPSTDRGAGNSRDDDSDIPDFLPRNPVRSEVAA